MAATSSMLALGTLCPPFQLPNAVDGKMVSNKDFLGKKGLLVSFLCNHCPYVVHIRPEYARLEKDYASRGLGIVGINSNSNKSHPQDGPEHMKALAKELGWGFPFLFDETQAVARAFHAECTPEYYLFDGDQKLVYRGQLDDSRPNNGKPVTGRDVRAAIEALLAGQPIASAQVPSVGCSIKWHPGA